MKPKKKKCPKCKKLGYVVSIFGSICPNCLYDPKEEVKCEHDGTTGEYRCLKCEKDLTTRPEPESWGVDVREIVEYCYARGMGVSKETFEYFKKYKFIWEQKVREEVRLELLKYKCGKHKKLLSILSKHNTK